MTGEFTRYPVRSEGSILQALVGESAPKWAPLLPTLPFLCQNQQKAGAPGLESGAWVLLSRVPKPRGMVLTQTQQTLKGNRKESMTFTMPCSNCETMWPRFLDMGAIPESLMLNLPLDNNSRTCTHRLNTYSLLSSSKPSMGTATLPDCQE